MDAAALPFGLQSGFLLLVLILYTLIARGLLARGPQLAKLVTIIAFWLTITGVLGISGFFANFTSMPPRLPVFVALETIFLVWAIFFSRWRDELARIPQSKLIGLQIFRLPVELLLSALAAERLLPVEMTFHGRNFDILIGASAPVVAWILVKRKSRALVLLWNLLGLLLLGNVVVTGLLSVPYLFQKLKLSVDNFIVGTFPVTWLPLFLVPLALALHLISLRAQLLWTSKAPKR